MIPTSYVQSLERDTRQSDPSKESAMYSAYEGLPAAASVQQAVSLAQLEILRRLERQRTGVAPIGG